MQSFDARLVTRNGDRIVVDVSGELDMSTAPQLLEVLDSSTDPATRLIELHVNRMSFIDSSGLGVLVRMHNRLMKHDDARPLRVVGPNQQARKVLEITGLLRVFDVVDSIPD